jgi:hypothetical protein
VATTIRWRAAGNLCEVAWPTGNADSGAGEGVTEVRPFVGVLQEFEGLTLQGTIGWERQLEAGGEDGLAYGWALALPTADRRLAAFAEVGGRWVRRREASTLAVAPGFRHAVAPGMSVGLAVPLGLRAAMSRWGVIAQFQFRLSPHETE